MPQPQERKTIVAATKELDKPDIKKDEKDKKPKPIMVDAQTQTDRSDYAIIKAR